MTVCVAVTVAVPFFKPVTVTEYGSSFDVAIDTILLSAVSHLTLAVLSVTSALSSTDSPACMVTSDLLIANASITVTSTCAYCGVLVPNMFLFTTVAYTRALPLLLAVIVPSWVISITDVSFEFQLTCPAYLSSIFVFNVAVSPTFKTGVLVMANGTSTSTLLAGFGSFPYHASVLSNDITYTFVLPALIPVIVPSLSTSAISELSL